MSTIRAHIFDFDGILADTECLHWQAMRDVLVPLEPTLSSTFTWERYQRVYIGFDDRDALRTAMEEAGKSVDDTQLRELVHAKARAFLDRVSRADIPPFPGAVEAVRAAAAVGPVALCTGAVSGDVEPLLKAFGIRELFAAVVTAEDVAKSKPDPESYVLAAKRLGIAPENCLAIEDTPHGLQAARGAGCQTLGVAQTHAPEDLTPFADRVIDNMVRFSVS
ncbi:MAG: HAD-IA family hydrolase [Verrucomicrobia bacterium]|nr:HAD-IA family hydrolase [Verrucomicrobiota bacterium]MCH8513584.1 HAD-IA family hydrolase [Kiritimatiellia bacterium]